MHRRRGALAALATAFLSLLAFCFAGPAAAGGPTSLLLVVPGEGRTASLYSGSADYAELARLVGAFDSITGSTTAPAGANDNGASGSGHASDPGVTLTWLMHDVSVWRVDRVYLNVKGGPWLSTQGGIGDSSEILSQPPLWRTVGNGKALSALLDRLGVGNQGSGTAPSGEVVSQERTYGEPENVTSVASGSSVTPDEATGLPGPDGWVWGPVGVLIGVVLTLGVRRWMVAEPEDAADLGPVDDEPGQPKVETLSSHPSGSR